MAEFNCIVPERLWQVNNLLSAEQVEDIITTDWMSLDWAKGPSQEHWIRRQVLWSDPKAQQLSSYITEQLPAINQGAGTEFKMSAGVFWIDEPGFTVNMHTDGHLANSLQMYWIVPDETYGTGFYNYKNKDSLLYQFLSRPNTGYLMLNHLNDDGSQPLQWHGMFHTVPEGSVRVSSYWQFR